MDLQKSCRRLAAWVLTLALAAALALPGGAVYAMPIQTANAQESVYLINAVTGEVLLDQNSGQQRCVASLTKMMTALLLLESGKNLDETITVPADLTEEFQKIRSQNGSTILLAAGEQLRRIDLLYALLVCSANDAASVIAWDVAGSIPAFVQQMNARAEQLGCTSTRFSCPHGLYDDGNVSTAQDMGKIAMACAQYEIYRQIADTLQYEIPASNLKERGAQYPLHQQDAGPGKQLLPCLHSRHENRVYHKSGALLCDRRPAGGYHLRAGHSGLGPEKHLRRSCGHSGLGLCGLSAAAGCCLKKAGFLLPASVICFIAEEVD